MKLLLTGATGVAGLAVYRAALQDAAVTHITILSRRPVPSWAVLPPDAPAKTTVILHKDFLSYPSDLAHQLAGNDACVWALGRSVIGMNERDYTEMTHDYPMAALRALVDAGVGEGRPDGRPFRFVYISGEHADPSGTSTRMWARVKGKAEVDIAELSDSVPNVKAHILRPGYFFPPSEYPEDRKHQRSMIAGMFDYVGTPLMNCSIPSLIAPTGELGSFALGLAQGRWPGQVIFRNAEMRQLMKATSE